MADNGEALANSIVGIIAKHNPQVPLSVGIAIAAEIMSRLSLDEYLVLHHRGTDQELIQVQQPAQLGFYGASYKLTPLGAREVVHHLKILPPLT